MASKPQKMPKVAKVKDKSPAEMQITAEQLLREAKERDLEIVPPPPRQKIADPEELQEYRLKKRRAFEDNIRKNRGNVSNWLKYSKWEEEQGEIRRARSVYERALDVEHRNITLWLKYAEMEMRSRQVNHARNVWDRAVTILPRASQFWYKYTYMEEMLHNVAGAREVFERWIKWEPDEQAWQTYIGFELRYKELERARAIYERFVYVHPVAKNWIKYARFEEKHGYINSSRRIYERAIEFYGDDHMEESLFIAFAKFEEGQKEYDRAKVIYRYALDHMSKDQCANLYNEYTRHEKKFGDRSSIDNVITSKRKFQYEEALKKNELDYDTWFDYVKMLEADGNEELVRETYERAIACVPPSKEKQHWRRYIYLWIYYAVYEECVTEDFQRAREVYKMCLQIIPHKLFTFAEIWLLYAKFEIRRKDVQAARKALGTAIGMCPKHKLFRGYIDLEIKLREFDRCRRLYEKWILFDPENYKCWVQFASLEALLGDVPRARAIYELAVSQKRLDMPEYLWKSYIDFEISLEEWPRVRHLHERLLQLTQHVKVWLSYAKVEQSIPDCGDRPRKIFQKANNILRSCEEKEQRIMLLDAWKEYEKTYGSEASLDRVKKLMPRRVIKRKQVTASDGITTRWEEYADFVFPDDETAKPSLILMSKAKEWKKMLESKESSEDTKETVGAESPSSESRKSDDKQIELSAKEKEDRMAIQQMFEDDDTENGKQEESNQMPSDPDLDKDDSDVEIGSTDSSSSDSESEDDEEKQLRVRQKMEEFRQKRRTEFASKMKELAGEEKDCSNGSSCKRKLSSPESDDRKRRPRNTSRSPSNSSGED